jgi:hypothetical protein
MSEVAKKNGTTSAVAAEKGATVKNSVETKNDVKGQVLIVKPSHGNTPQPIEKPNDTGNEVANNLLQPAPLSADERLKQLPILAAHADKIKRLDERLSVLKQMQALKTGDGEKMVIHINKDTILNVDNPGAINEILTLLVNTNETKLNQAKQTLAQINF